MRIIYGVIAILSLLAGLAFLSNATSGVGLIGTACFFAICMRIAQAEDHAKALLDATNQRTATTMKVSA
jgi:hypothetical protein